MPVTKTAKRAIRVSNRKQIVNKAALTKFEVAMRSAKKERTKKTVIKAISLTDRVAKKGLIHKNKASRIKRNLSKLLPKQRLSSKKKGKTSK